MVELSASKKQRESTGFTLIELLVVISIISLLSSVVFTTVNSARRKGRDAARAANVKALKLALELYYDDNNGYPTVPIGNGDVSMSESTFMSRLVPRYLSVMPALLLSDGDRYYAGGFTTGVAPTYDLLIYSEGTISPNPCRSGTMPGTTGNWGVATVCSF